MSDSNHRLMFPLFLPATRLERLPKALASGASCVIVDLEDAVAPADKPQARANLAALSLSDTDRPVYVRINAADTEWFQEDLQAVQQCGAAGMVLPKAEDTEIAIKLRRALPSNVALFGLVETARGIADVRDLATVFDRLFFGSLDYAADLGCAHTTPALAHARAEIVLAARLAGQPGPIDGVTADIRNASQIREDAALGAELGFAGKLLIHPEQVEPAKQGYRPDEIELIWAKGIIESAGKSGVSTYQGTMVDAPVIARANRLLVRATDTMGGH
jgi:citrate lyase subunit beta / citryl-CoA lyase